MTVSEAIIKASQVLHREVRQASVYTLDDEFAKRSFRSHGIGIVVNDDGSVLVDMKPVLKPFRVLMRSAMYHIARKEGALGFFSNMEEARSFAVPLFLDIKARGLAPQGVQSAPLTDDDVSAFIERCGHNDPVGREVARGICAHVLGCRSDHVDDAYVRQVAAGVHVYRNQRREDMMRSGNEEDIIKLGRETLNRYSGHYHLHLGRPVGVYAMMGYPDYNMFIGANSLRSVAVRCGTTVDTLLDQGLIEGLRKPLGVFRDTSRKIDGRSVLYCVPRLLLPGERVLKVYLPSVEEAVGMVGEKSLFDSVKMNNAEPISLSDFCKILSFRIRDDVNPNIVCLKTAPGLNYSYEVFQWLRELAYERRGKKKAGTGLLVDSCGAILTDTLIGTAKIPLNFKNPKKNSVLENLFIREDDKVHPEAAVSVSLRARRSRAEVLRAAISFDVMADGKRLFSPATAKKLMGRGILRNADLVSEFRRMSVREKVLCDAGIGRKKTMNEFAAAYGNKAYAEVERYLTRYGLNDITIESRPVISLREAAQRDPEDVRKECFSNLFKHCPKDIAPGTLMMPRSAVGAYFLGADAYMLLSAMAGVQRWNGCGVFLSIAELEMFSLSLKDHYEAVYLSGDRGPVVNLLDTDIEPALAEEVLSLLRKEDTAAPQPLVRHMVSFLPGAPGNEASLLGRFDDRFSYIVEGYDLSPSPLSLETAIARAEQCLVAKSHVDIGRQDICGIDVKFSYNGRLRAFCAVGGDGSRITALRDDLDAISVSGSFCGHEDAVREAFSCISRAFKKKLDNSNGL